MTSVVKSWAPLENFWVINPAMQLFGAFKDVYTNDKSKNKRKSSNLMWAIATVVDPHEDNILRNRKVKERKELAKLDIIKDKKFDWDDEFIKKLLDFYTEGCLTVAERELVRIEEKAVQRGDFIAKVTYTMDTYDEDTKKIIKGTADQLDKLILNTGKIFDEINSIKDKIGKESLDGHLKGGATESAGESGLI